MDNKQHKIISANAQMLIRKSAAEVFDAFIDPEKTKAFWFTKGSARLEVDKEVAWTWEMYNFSAKVMAIEIVENKRIVFKWLGAEIPTLVTIEFQELNPEATFVTIMHNGFNKTGDELVAAIIDSTEGFNMVLAGLKSFLEHGINLNLVADKSPKELTDH